LAHVALATAVPIRKTAGRKPKSHWIYNRFLRSEKNREISQARFPVFFCARDKIFTSFQSL
jgi:hypothetical protein